MERVRYKNIGITGAEGHIGTVLRRGLSNDYSIKSFTKTPVEFPSRVADLSKKEQVRGIFVGLDAVIHLAADPDPASFWESVRENNIEATYQVIEECRESGIKRIVFATTNHVQHGNTLLTTPESIDTSKKILMKVNDPPNPDSLYAVSKLFGENVGKLYSERFGLEFVGLRIGWTIPEDDPSIYKGKNKEDYIRAMFLSQRDCIQAFKRALEVEAKYIIAYAVSNNDRRVFDLTETIANLGFHPQDNAEDFFNRK